MGELVLVTGGARSGKSDFAQSLVSADADAPVTYVATAEALDVEMAERIRRHRARRPAHWRTVEAPIDADRRVAQLAAEPGWVILDCLTIFLANILEETDDDEIFARADAMAEAVLAGRGNVVVVTNEVGSGIVPDNPLARRFRDTAGLANQRLARKATAVYLAVAGLIQQLK